MAEQTITKRCSKCKQIKLLLEFYKESRAKDGHRSNCKTCCYEYEKKYKQTEQGKETQKRKNQTGKGRARNKRYRQSEKGKAKERRFHIRHPEHRKAKDAVNNAIKAGKVPKANTLHCHYCSAQAEEYHHYKGYKPEHWLDIMPICIKCHKKNSLKIVPVL